MAEGRGDLMRRYLEKFLPVVLLAVVVQMIAPLGALQAVARAASDPLSSAVICSGHTDSDGNGAAPAGNPADHGGCCVLCGTGLAGVAVLDPPPGAFVLLHRAYQRVVWLAPRDASPPLYAGSLAQARAPPFVS